MSKTIMIIGAGPFQLPAIRKAKAMGLKVLAVDGNAEAIGLKEADYGFGIDIKDIPGCLEKAREYKINGIITVASDVSVVTVAEVAKILGLPGTTPEAARIATNKFMMREKFSAAGLLVPQYFKSTNQAEALQFAGKIGYPVVVKPVDSSGSRGVSFVENSGQFETAFQMAQKYSLSGPVIVEEFVPGEEISVEGFVYRGEFKVLTLSDKTRTKPPYLLDTAVKFPSDYSLSIQDEAKSVAAKAVAACGLDNCTIHMEILLGPKGPVVVELAARGAGFHVFSEILPWVTGVDVIGNLIKIALGEKPDFSEPLKKGAVLIFPFSSPGVVRNISGLEEARKTPGIFLFDTYVKKGDQVRVLTSGADRVAAVIALDQTRELAQKTADLAISKFKIEI